MLERLRTKRRALLHLAAMAGVLGLAAGLVGQGATPAHAELTQDNGLLVSTREDFRLCVDTTSSTARAADVRAAVVAGVAQVQRHPDWKAAFGAPSAGARAAVAPSCPTVRLPDRVDRTTVVGPGITDSPSPYRTWVHVLDDRTADRLLGPGVAAVNVSAELMRTDERNVATVSTAVLVRDSRLDDPAFRGGLLTEGIGLRATVGTPDASGAVHSVKGASATRAGGAR